MVQLEPLPAAWRKKSPMPARASNLVDSWPRWARLFPDQHAEGFRGLPSYRAPGLAPQWYYAGTILMACAFLCMGAMLAYRCRRDWWGQHPWTAAAIVSLWLALGTEGMLWTAMGTLPVIRAVNHHPHRLMPFFVFFSLIVGGMFLERMLRRSASRKWEYLIAAVTAALMLYHVSLARNSLWCYGDRPYPELPKEIAERVLPSQNPNAGRVWSFSPFRAGLPGFAWALPLSLPSAYGAYAFSGYDPIIAARPETAMANAAGKIRRVARRSQPRLWHPLGPGGQCRIL